MTAAGRNVPESFSKACAHAYPKIRDRKVAVAELYARTDGVDLLADSLGAQVVFGAGTEIHHSTLPALCCQLSIINSQSSHQLIVSPIEQAQSAAQPTNQIPSRTNQHRGQQPILNSIRGKAKDQEYAP
jgi:hypothetical protein